MPGAMHFCLDMKESILLDWPLFVGPSGIDVTELLLSLISLQLQSRLYLQLVPPCCIGQVCREMKLERCCRKAQSCLGLMRPIWWGYARLFKIVLRLRLEDAATQSNGLLPSVGSKPLALFESQGPPLLLKGWIHIPRIITQWVNDRCQALWIFCELWNPYT